VTYEPAISAGGAHCLALCPNGTVVAWPLNQEGDLDDQSTVPPGLTNVTAIAAGTYHSLALRDNGTVVAWGLGWGTESYPPIQNVTAIAEGGLALLNNGTVRHFNKTGFIDVPWFVGVPARLTTVTAIASSEEHMLALLRNGTVVAWGRNSSGQCNVPPGLTNVTAIAAWGGVSSAVLANGSAVHWGYGCPKPNNWCGLSEAKAISLGGGKMVLRNDGSVVCITDVNNPIVVVTDVNNPIVAERGGVVKAISFRGSNEMTLFENDTVRSYTIPSWGPRNQIIRELWVSLR
jgi:hypothetical protein